MREMMRRNVLIISRYFPPGGGVGAFRAAKFVKYLPSFGWKPYVVSLPPKRQNQLLPDEIDRTQYASIAEIPEERIYIDVVFSSIDRSLGDIQRLPLFAQKIPQIVNKYNIDVIFHTAPPFYSLPSISWISRKTTVPYIIDLRDPWYINNEVFKSTKSGSNSVWTSMNKLLEYNTIRDADRVTVATSEMRSMYANKYSQEESKFVTIENGYDPADYEVNSSLKKPAVDLQMIYPGKFRADVRALIQSIKAVNERKTMKLIHFGDREHKYTKQFYEQSEEIGISDYIEKRGYVEFEKVVANIRNSDVGLVIARKDDPTHVPQKTFDYIACDIPILALGPENSELDKMLKPFDYAYRVDHENYGGIIEILKTLIETKPQTLGANEELQKYTREKMTERLVSVFDDVL